MAVTDETPICERKEPTNAYAALKQARVDSDGKMEFMRKSSYIVHDSTLCLIFSILLLLCIPVVNIAMGGVYIHSCPAERLIPIFLIVAGCFAIIFYIPDIVSRVNKATGKEEEDTRVRSAGCGAIGLFLVIWFVLGSVWIYGSYDNWTPYPNTAPNYCHPVLYYYSFSVVSLIYVCLFFSFCMSFCLCMMAI